MTAKASGGRPPFKPTAANRRTVSVAAGAGMTHEEIAIGIGISIPTLRKYFERELSELAYQRRLEVLDAMHKCAVGGNVAAQKAYTAMIPSVAAPPAPADPADAPKPIGKKAQANEDAKTAQMGTEWHDLLKPAAQSVQ